MAPRTAVVTQRLTRRFGDLTALHNLDLTLQRGEIYSLIGSNGSGKTTLAKIITGALKPSEGHFQVLDAERDHILPKRVGYMPQEGALYGDLTVRGNLRYFASLYGVPKRRDRIDEVAAIVHLESRMDSRVRTLSGGMKRRASLACALLADPELLILDEPTVGVDPVLRAELWDTFRHMTRRDRTVLITTHYLDEAQRSDRVGLLHAGRLLSEGAPKDVLRDTGTDNLEDAFYTLLRREQVARDAASRHRAARVHPRSRRLDTLPRAEVHLKTPPRHPTGQPTAPPPTDRRTPRDENGSAEDDP